MGEFGLLLSAIIVRILSTLTEYEENLQKNYLFTKDEGTMKRKSYLLISHSLELDA